MSQVVTRGRGWQGAVLKLLGGDDFRLTVTGSEVVTDHYVRLTFTGGGLLAKRAPHPTMWIRLWFDDAGRLHQRGYTVVDADPVADTFGIEFAIHDGIAARWAQQAQPGDTINATVMGSRFAMPADGIRGWIIAGDPASLPAINSLLDAIEASDRPEMPATIWLEYQHESDRSQPLRARAHDTVHWIAREDEGAALVHAVRASAFAADDHFGWVALDSVSTRAVSATLRNEYGIPKKSVKAQAYWIPGKSFV
ncbi:siderophore-interacting protein [Gordonia amicalis]|uniref:Siderophore-interacting protein n=1 Tax=Gordonia amicalis TaxID=89053 RepID=A0AAE4RAP3_9ACTN|nr:MULTISPECIES: siderophore-interacting protein [Gordonia]MCZ4581318.1 siderophore-interacting protein [Gordonia amicalis]MDV6313856.1 siderophore-interacting protein [Gordonia amicalis]MDV7102383.1 siderophore-interacting protein [Gordonia amicalis]UPW12937.1 siderophore-interacting protein [Gordonia amicalis]